MRKILTTGLLTVSFAFAGLYDYAYNANAKSKVVTSQQDKLLMYGDFDKILRFQAIQFSPATHQINQESKKRLDEIVKAIEAYKDEKILVTLIGYTQHVESHNERVIRESSFTYKDLFPNAWTKKRSSDHSLSYAQGVEQYLLNSGVEQERLVVEHRRDEEKAFLEITKEAQTLNHRVMVSIYDLKEKPQDRDADGVIDAKDQCPDTKKGLAVDSLGCALQINLEVLYDNDSSVIKADQMKKVNRFAEFLKTYPQYHADIIGHTSNTASASYNEKLSLRRANSIINELTKAGIDASRLKAFGKGEREPIASNQTEEGRALNRRIMAQIRLEK